MTFYEERMGQDLAQIRKEVARIGARAGDALRDAVHALLTSNRSLANSVILEDNEINRAVRALDHECHAFVVRHLPSAGPLRFVSSVLRITVALERIGDYAVTVAREMLQLTSPPPETVRRDIELIAHQSWRMLEDALTAFDHGDVDLARSTMGMQYQIEVTYSKVYEDLMEADEADARPVRDIFALLGIMVGVGRVGDQAKNICEETVFTVTGETKEPKVFRILFVDQRNDCLSQLAEAYARKAFPNSGIYASAGWEEPGTLDPALLSFMDEHNLDVRKAVPERVRPVVRELGDYHVIVSLQGDIDEVLPRRPYRTVLLEWDVAPCPEDPGTEEGRASLLDCYRELTVRIRNLMEDLRGPGAD